MPNTPRLTPIVRPTPPRGNRNAMGAPSREKITQAIAMANFFSISTWLPSMIDCVLASCIFMDSTSTGVF